MHKHNKQQHSDRLETLTQASGISVVTSAYKNRGKLIYFPDNPLIINEIINAVYGEKGELNCRFVINVTNRTLRCLQEP